MTRAAHILSVVQHLDGGGVEAALLRLAAGWVERGRRVTLVAGDVAGPLAAALSPGIEVVAIGDRRYHALARALPAIVAARAPDVVFCPGNHYTAVAAWLRLRLGRRAPPVAGKVSNTLTRGGPAYRAWLRLHPAFLDHVVAMTPGMADEAAATLGIAWSRLHVIANPSRTPAPAEAQGRSVVDPGLPLSREHTYLVGVGRLVPQKRWDRVIAALPQLGDVPLLILGEGPERAALTAQAAALEVADRIHLLGHVADPLPLIEGAAVLVLASDFEGVPGVLREALSVGTPVVATDSSVAVRELVTGPELGSVVPCGDAAALVAALNWWLTPGRARPRPILAAGDPVGDYLALFDSVVATSSSS
ncbi:Glycosyltransferase involved in cell wall bisynthesis [Sphingomonas guangdongensis]|uniref:Glycosyltransferase involved in cell wall bisynthesis n=1 Tax=Sphingomonas guangdongensis TaxID=1141890 RepID=A0A285QDV2_9SPHN|nr:glycosyltransferase [Sphingomonas guangdongensis]SOB79619.1 Glycosyltransferase involved in cell wall bisynthesis [Sphingomonas guangdongensis]